MATETVASDLNSWSDSIAVYLANASGGYDQVVHLEFLGRGIRSWNTDTQFDRTQMNIDPSEYDGARYYFEVVAKNTDTVAREIRVINASGTIQTRVKIPASTSNFTRIRSTTPWNPASGVNTYRVETEATTSTEQVDCYQAAVVVLQVNATKTTNQFLICLAGPGVAINSAPQDDAAPIYASNPTNWATHEPKIAANWRKDESVLSTIGDWRFEVVIRSSNGVNVCWTRIYNETNAASVADSEQFTTINVPTLRTVTLSNSATDWDDGDDFTVQWRASTAATQSQIYVMRLYCRVDPLSDVEHWHQVLGSVEMQGSKTLYDEGRKLCEKDSFSSLAGIYHHASAREEGAAQGKVYLDDDGTDDSGTSGTTNVSVLNISGNYVRSNDIQASLTDGNRYIAAIERVSGGVTEDIQHIVTWIVYRIGSTLTVSVEDDAGFLADFFVPASGSLSTFDQLSITAASNWANLADAFSQESYGQLEISPSDDMANFADALSEELYVQLGITASGSTNNWADALSAASSRRFGQNVLLVGEIQQEDGTTYISDMGVRMASGSGISGRYYNAHVLSWGNLDRSIPVPAGTPVVGDVEITLADTDQTYRKLFAQKTPRKDKLVLKLGLEGGSEALFQKIYEGEITNAQFPPGEARVQATDISFEFLREKLPSLITEDNFSGLPENVSEVFAPILFGEVSGSGLNDVGALKLEHINVASNYWGGFRHPLKEVTTCYLKNPSAETFTSVGFSVVEETKTIDDIDYTFTYVVPAGAQEGAEVRIDAKGMTDTNLSSGTLAENMADLIRYALTRFGSGITDTAEHLDLDSFTTVKNKIDTEGWVFAGAETATLTFAEWIAKLVSSSNVDFYQNKSGKLAIALILDEDDNRPVFDDTFKILLRSENISLADPVVNKLIYKYNRIYATSEWHTELTFNNDTDQEALGEEVEDTFELWYVRSAATAEEIIRNISSYLDLNSYRMQLDLPAPETIDQLELAKQVGVTHYGGLDSSGAGWTNEEFKVIGINFDLDRLTYRVNMIHRVYLRNINQQLDNVEWVRNLRTGPHPGSANGVFYGMFRYAPEDTRMNAVRTLDYGASWSEIDLSTFAALANTIGSADSHLDGNYIHVATQEATTGRVAYHRFNISANSWDIYNEEVLASVSGYETAIVSITVADPSGKPVIYYSSTPSSTAHRGAFKERSSATALSSTWSSETVVTSGGRAGSDWRPSRVIAGVSNRLHFFWTDHDSSFRHEYNKTRKADGTMGSAVQWLVGNLTYYAVSLDNLNMGQYARDSAGGFIVPFKAWFGEPYYAEFGSKDLLDIPAKSGLGGLAVYEGNNNAGEGCNYPGISISLIGSTKHFLIAKFTGTQNWNVYKSPDGATPAGAFQSKVGPDLAPQGASMQNTNAHIFSQGGKTYIANFLGLDIGQAVGWQFYDTADLPTATDFDKTDFLNNLG